MLDYDKDFRIKIFFIRLVDFLNPFKTRKFIFSLIYLDIKNEPRVVLLQQVLNSFGKKGWELVSVLKDIDSKFLNVNGYFFQKKVGRFEYWYYSKILNKETEVAIKKMNNLMKKTKNKDIDKKSIIKSNNYSLDNFRKCKSNTDKNIFFKNLFNNNGEINENKDFVN